jgi:flagellar biosynthetic protein FliQ
VSPGEIVGLAHEMMMLTLMLVTPFLLGAILASLLIGLLQATTRMNDLTLSFAPRFFVVLLVLYFGATWASGRMTAYVERAALAIRNLHG